MSAKYEAHRTANTECSRIWAGIVTYNPDLVRLRENVEAIKSQVETLLMFDNGSKNIDGIKNAFHDTVIIDSSDNLGMACALNHMARIAFDLGATDIVFLDQDSVVSDGFVNTELAQRRPDIGIICPLINDRNVEAADVDKSQVLDVDRAVTSGSMINLSAWKAVGGYDERLFVDNVDNEFCDNLRAHGFRIVRTNSAEILHEMGHQEYAWGICSKSRAYYRRNYPAWRWEDSAYSQALIIRKYGGTAIGDEEKRRNLKLIGRILLIEKDRINNLRSYVKGYLRGVRDAADAASCDRRGVMQS